MSDTTLALFGGTPVVEDHQSLLTRWPVVTSDDREAVLAAFDRADFSGRGSAEVYALEEEMAVFFGMPCATALNSGTAALHAALFSLEIGSGAEVIVPNLTFVSTAMAVVHNGSTPVFADVDANTYNLSAATIARELSSKTAAVIVVHLHGLPADMDPIIQLCHSKGIKVIEDVAQAPGARYKGRLVGSIGDAAAFSLMAQKNLATCGEGGVLLNRNNKDKNRAELIRLYGEKIQPGQARKYRSYTLGWNYTLNPIQAAMARTQLRRLPEVTRTICAAGANLSDRLSQFVWVTPPVLTHDFQNVFHFYRVALSGSSFGFTDDGRFRRAVQDALNAEGLNVRHYQTTPVSGQPYFQTGSDRCVARPLPEYPATLEVLRRTLVLGAVGSAPAYLLNPRVPELYAKGFAKIEKNMSALIDYARDIDYLDTWQSEPVLSDTFGAEYESGHE